MELQLAKELYKEIKKENYDPLKRRVYEHRVLLFLGSFFDHNSDLTSLSDLLTDGLTNPNLRTNIFTIMYLRGERKFTNSNLSFISLLGFDMQDFNFNGCNLEGSDLRKCNLQDASLKGANLSNCSLSDSNLRGANLKTARFVKSDLTGAHLAGCEMESVNLRHAHLCGTDMTGVHMPHANLREAYLYKCSCRFANLVKSDFRKALLVEADFAESDLTNCDLRESDLRFANLRSAILTQTKCDGADFLGTDLREAAVPHVMDGVNIDLAYSNRPILRLVKNPIPHLTDHTRTKSIDQTVKRSSSTSK